MSLISVSNLSCEQGGKKLFSSATFSIDPNDKIALIGQNGCGKSTLLSLIQNAVRSPNEAIAVQRDLRISALNQEPPFDATHTIYEHLYNSESEASKAIKHYYTQLALYNNNQSSANEEAYSKALDMMNHLNLWDYEAKVGQLLKELHIENLEQKLAELSGGMRKKIALAQTFIEERDLLILDEPTNHLDILTIEWLENSLKQLQSAIIMVTHDRYFLDKVCNKIIEIDQNKIFVYKGNYQDYLEQRAARYEAQEKQESKIQSLLRSELQWLRRGPKARSTKQKARKDRIHALINREKLSSTDLQEFETQERRLGKKILKLITISKSFDNKLLIKDFSYTLTKGERIGILGPNGVGKTTLLKLIMQELNPDSGEVDVGVNTSFGYFDQHSHDLNLDYTVYEQINDIGSQFVCQDGSTISATKLLERFLFPGTMLKSKIGDLSGGERRRLHLICLLLKNPNVLLFDEPTNDLDIQTLSILEDFLESFSGCVILISHDRYFMDRVVNHLLIFDKNSHITSFHGNYSDYQDTLADIQNFNKKQTQNKAKSIDSKDYKDNQKEIKQLEKEIELLEQEKKALELQFENPATSPEDYKNTGLKIKEINTRIDTAFSKWESLS